MFGFYVTCSYFYLNLDCKSTKHIWEPTDVIILLALMQVPCKKTSGQFQKAGMQIKKKSTVPSYQ